MFADGAYAARPALPRCGYLGNEASVSPAGPRLNAGAGLPQSGRLARLVGRPAKRRVARGRSEVRAWMRQSRSARAAPLAEERQFLALPLSFQTPPAASTHGTPPMPSWRPIAAATSGVKRR